MPLIPAPLGCQVRELLFCSYPLPDEGKKEVSISLGLMLSFPEDNVFSVIQRFPFTKDIVIGDHHKLMSHFLGQYLMTLKKKLGS